MSKKSQKQRRHRRRTTPVWIWPVGGVLLLVAAVLLARSSKDTSRDGVENLAPIEVSGQAGIRVDQELIDYGDVPFNVEKSFVITVISVGSEPLRFRQAPYIEIVEGC